MRSNCLALLATVLPLGAAFQNVVSNQPSLQRRRQVNDVLTRWATTGTSTTSSAEALEEAVGQLKRVLEREYASFFSPMEREWYADDVTFDDPMTSLEGIDSYERNVDMLSGKNLVGNILFRDAGIVLHNIEGGEVLDDGSISNLITRWTLRLTFQALPWQPTARFSGISVYDVKAGGSKGVQVMKQTDFWDSINLIGGGGSGADAYQQVPKSKAFGDFFNQLKSENFAAPSAGAELPYQLLRRGADYEVRRYPPYVAVQTDYERRDLGFSELGAFCSGMNPLAPALMTVDSDDKAAPKSMMWPLAFAPPGSSDAPVDPAAAEKAQKEMWSDCNVVTIPGRVVAVGSFSDASLEPVVRKADRLLRQACERDGLDLSQASKGKLSFAQYDAIFSMGNRRGEVWVELDKDGHPWSAE